MNEKSMMRKKIHELDFAIHELVLYLDTHKNSKRALDLLEEFRELREEAIEAYEEKYGKYILTPADAGNGNTWNWINSPWPWEKEFMED